jgi:type IV secretory pathway VirD2 relaxase
LPVPSKTKPQSRGCSGKAHRNNLFVYFGIGDDFIAYLKMLSHHSGAANSINYILNPEKTGSSIAYAANPDKTAGQRLVTTIGCDIATASKRFEWLQRLYRSDTPKRRGGGKEITSHHIIQSFKGYECSADEAHRIAKELIEAKYGNNVCAVIATHIDRDNIHNHIVINSVGYDGKKIYNNKTEIKDLQRHSDSLCVKYDLSVINKPVNKGLQYNEWQHRKNGTSWKEDIRNDIDRAVLDNDNWPDFVKQLKEMGYKVNAGPHRKYATLEKDGFRPIRFRTLGYHYEEERLKERMADPQKHYIDFTLLRDERGRLRDEQRQDAHDQKQSFAVFAARKRLEYSLSNSIIALQYLKATEIIFRLIVNNLTKRTVKFDLRNPYGVMNDYYLRRYLQRLVFIERNGIKTKREYLAAIGVRRTTPPQAVDLSPKVPKVAGAAPVSEAAGKQKAYDEKRRL